LKRGAGLETVRPDHFESVACKPSAGAPCGSEGADGAPVHDERHRPEQTTLYRLVQQHMASFIAHTEARTGAERPRFVKDEFYAFLECGILRLLRPSPCFLASN
jgi:hypothetical protein